MSWLKIDDSFAEHAKVYALSDRAFRLHVAALCYCARNLTDGLIDERGLRVISITAKVKKASIFVAELVATGLWKATPKGHQVRDYLDYNPSAADVKEARKKAAERKARSRSHDGSHGVTDTVTDGVSHAGSHASPSRPVPLEVISSVVSKDHEVERAANSTGFQTDIKDAVARSLASVKESA